MLASSSTEYFSEESIQLLFVMRPVRQGTKKDEKVLVKKDYSLEIADD